MVFNGFRLKDYKQICNAIANSNYKTYTLRKYLEEKPKRNFIILRHDVDYNIDEAIKIAETELSFGINSTYFIRLNNKTTKEKIRQLSSVSTEIGLHYDALAKANNNVNKAIAIFRNQLDYLNSVVEVKTISAHGSSIKATRNTKLLENFNIKQYNIIGDAMISIDFENIPYYSDAGRTWNLHKNKLRDFPDKSIQDYIYIDRSNELCSIIVEEYYEGIYISSHPELWAKNSFFDILKEVKYGGFRFHVKKFIKNFNEILNTK